MGVMVASPFEIVFAICGLIVTAWLLNSKS